MVSIVFFYSNYRLHLKIMQHCLSELYNIHNNYRINYSHNFDIIYTSRFDKNWLSTNHILLLEKYYTTIDNIDNLVMCRRR